MKNICSAHGNVFGLKKIKGIGGVIIKWPNRYLTNTKHLKVANPKWPFSVAYDVHCIKDRT